MRLSAARGHRTGKDAKTHFFPSTTTTIATKRTLNIVTKLLNSLCFVPFCSIHFIEFEQNHKLQAYATIACRVLFLAYLCILEERKARKTTTATITGSLLIIHTIYNIICRCHCSIVGLFAAGKKSSGSNAACTKL